MFELRVACRYLLPNRHAFSTTLVSLLSTAIIAVVIWLVLVFLSVVHTLEKNWVNKLTALQAPLRISPTENYYRSYYYRIDALSSASNFSLKSLGEKATAEISDPYTDQDPPLPLGWPTASRSNTGVLLDPVKELVSLLQELGLTYQDYEVGAALLSLETSGGSTLSQMSYLLSFLDQNPSFTNLLLPPIPEDIGPKVTIKEGHCEWPIVEGFQSILLPKPYQEMGVRVGHRGSLRFSNMQSLSTQEQHIPVRVVGFYDPGLMSVGLRCAIVPSTVIQAVRTNHRAFSPDGTPMNGIFVWTDLSKVDQVKKEIETRLKAKEISSLWKVASYKEYESSKEFFLQLQSDRMLFVLIAILILGVACTNVISLLVLLVRDKRKEIAILRAMGASSLSILTIFGICGLTIGVASSALGTFAAFATLRYLGPILQALSLMQGSGIIAQNLPHAIPMQALLMVIWAPFLSLVAALIPAWRASRLCPAAALRRE